MLNRTGNIFSAYMKNTIVPKPLFVFGSILHVPSWLVFMTQKLAHWDICSCFWAFLGESENG